MAARTKGSAQIKVDGASTHSQLFASLDTADPIISTGAGPFTAASDRADAKVFLIAGTGYVVTWGGVDNSSAVWGAGLSTNTAVWRCDIMYETTQTSVASDTTTIIGVGASVNRTFTFTPTLTGTYRLKTNLVVTVTAGGAAFANDNTDNGNFGSAAPSRLAGSTLVSFTPGLASVGTSATYSRTPVGSQYYFTQAVTSIANTLTFGVASQGTDASETITVSWRDHLDAQFATTSIAPTASATKTGSGLSVQPAAGFPAANEAIGLHFLPGSSALSTALGGAGIAWTFFTTAGIPAGFTAVSGPSVGAWEIKQAALFNADPRMQCHAHAQKTSTFAADTVAAPLPFDGFDKDVYNYVIAADLLFIWGAAFNMNNVGQNSITLTPHLNDALQTTPNTSGSGGDHTTTFPTTTTGATTLGWTAKASPWQPLAPQAPAGNWHVWIESATDGTNTWSRSNGYLVNDQGNVMADGFGSPVFATALGFLSPYSADKVIAVDGPNEVSIGEARKYLVRYVQRQSDGTITHLPFDSTDPPTARVFEIDSTTGDERDVLATANLTGPFTPTSPAPANFPTIPSGVYYLTPTITFDAPKGVGQRHYILRVAAQYAGGKVISNSNIDVKPAFAVTVGPLSKLV